MNLVIFSIYMVAILILFAGIAVVIIHIGQFREYSKYLSTVLRIYLITIVIIAIFWGYKILTNQSEPVRKTTVPVELDF